MNIQQIIKMIEVHSGIPSALRLMRVKKKKKAHNKLRLVFLCQLPQLWGCFQSVYEAAAKDPDVEAYILAVPEEWGKKEINQEAYEYMKQSGYPVLKGYEENTDSFYDLEKLQPDYVFLPRPYDHYLPTIYQSESLSKYTKVCYVCYGYTSEGQYMLKTAFSKYFITNCYMVFAENRSVEQYCKKCLPISSRLGIRKIIKTPFPRFDLLKQFEGKEGAIWQIPRSQSEKRIIWTPRWTLDEKLGGTNFFSYKDFFFAYAKKHPQQEIAIRPHPLAFENFVKAGKMTREEVEQYKKTCSQTENVQLDQNKEYLDSFASADILVSDMSGVVVDFAVTEKPVIFCSYREEFNEANKALMEEAYYVVKDQKELEEVLELLCRGEDPKREQRKRVVKEVLGICDGRNGERILGVVKRDFQYMGS